MVTYFCFVFFFSHVTTDGFISLFLVLESFASAQFETNPVLRVSKVALSYPLCPGRKLFFLPCNKSFIDQACTVKMAR